MIKPLLTNLESPWDQKVCMTCLKRFVIKSKLNQHIKRFHRPQGQAPVEEFDVLRQSGELSHDNGVQSNSQTKFENADDRIDVASQTDFDNDDQSMIVNVD